jgi:hypothetical protein
MVAHIGHLMYMFGAHEAPITTVEFREALRYAANILETLYSEAKEN